MLDRKENPERDDSTPRKEKAAAKPARDNSSRMMEPLENRQMMSTVTVSAASDWMGAINNSHAGDTIKFAPGNYNVSGNVNLPARTYQGNGATLNGGGLNINGSDVSGFTFNSTNVTLSGSGDNVHGNTITGNTSVTLAAGVSNSQLSHNNFHGTMNYAVRGYPGSNVSVEYNSVDLRGVQTGTGDNTGEEWLHLLGAANNLSVSHNVIQGNLLRWGIELQNGMTNLKVQNNYIHANNGGSGISLAIGGDATAPFAHAGENVDVSGNVVVADTNPYFACALEIDGDKNINVHDNYFSGFLWGMTNGTGGQAGEGLHTANNTIVYGSTPYADGDNTPWKTPARVSTNDHVYKIGTAGIPAAPSAPTSVGVASDGSTGDSPTYVASSSASSTPAPTTLTASSPSGSEIDLSWKDNSGGKATYVVQRKTTHGGDGYVTVATLGTGVTSFKDKSNVQANWEYDYVVTAVQGGVSSADTYVTAQATGGGAASSGATVASPIVAPTIATAPTSVIATARSSSEIDLSWGDTNQKTGAYVVQRKSSHGSDAYTTIATLPASATSYKDTTNVQPNWEYDYQIIAVIGQTTAASSVHAQALAPGQVNAAAAATSTAATTVAATTKAPSKPTSSKGATKATATVALSDANVGTSTKAGSSSVSKGVYRVSSGSTADKTKGTSHFAYEQISGDASVTARVSGSGDAAAGISMRAGTAASTSSVSLTIAANGHVTLVTADANGVAGATDAGAASAGAHWVKLVRSGDTITGYYSENGSVWQRAGSTTIALPTTLNAGLSAASKADGSSSTAQFHDVAITAGASAAVVVKGSKNKTDTSTSTSQDASGNGLTAKVYSNAHLSGKAVTHIDSDVNFNWGNATPDSSVTSAPYSVKWTGMVEAPTSDTYTFTIHSDSAVKLWVNDKLVVANPKRSSVGDDSGTIHLAAGHKYNIKMEYAEKTANDSTVSLLWSSSTQGSQVIPQASLFSAAA